MLAKMLGRRVLFSVLSLGLGTSLLILALSAQGQFVRPIKKFVWEQEQPIEPTPPVSPGTSAQFSAIKLVGEPKLAGVVEAAKGYLKIGNWEKGVTALQESILDKEGNFYVQVHERDGATGRETSRWTSVKFEANNLLGTMSEDGMDFYENKYGPDARDMLNEAKKKGDREGVAMVAQRYMYTRAGIEANDLLATYFLDRGQYFVAALRLEKILEINPARSRLSDMTLFKAVLAYSRSGDSKRAEDAWKRLLPRLEANGGLKIGDELVAAVKLKELLADNGPPRPFVSPFDWLMIRGDLSNAAQAIGSQPALDYTVFPARSTIADSGYSADPMAISMASKMIDGAIREQQALNGPIMSGFFPIVANKTVIFRTHNKVHAVALRNTKDPTGRDIPAGGIVWEAGGINSLVNTISDPNLSYLNSFWGAFGAVPGYRSFIYENSLIGTISCDNRLVYIVDDLAIPAAPNLLPSLGQQNAVRLKPRVLENVLSAFDVAHGKCVWNLGKWNYAVNPADQSDERPNSFANSHFLSVPISVGGKLYVLNEKNPGLTGDAELRLVCIDPDPLKVKNGQPFVVPIGTKGELWQDIGTVAQHSRFTHDPLRRTNAAHMAYGEGIIVCTTNAGEVLGVDVLSRGLAWSYPYREQSPTTSQPIPPGPPFRPNLPAQQLSLTLPIWKSSPPVIQEGKVVFTAPDASSIHCINLRDGTPVWKKKHQEGDLYVAGVFSGKVLVVGKTSVRVLRLSDGTQLWQEPTLGMPSGQGVASKNIYYLPLKRSDRSEIVALDLDRLAVKSRNPAVSSKDDVGNLLFYDGMVVSQTPTTLVAYPELKLQLDLASKKVEADPNNPVNLFKRGKWLLADGQVQLAVDDFRKALKNDLPADMRVEARRKLFMAFTDLMQINFKEASTKYLVEYREICNVPDNTEEQQERLAKYFRVVGEGHESLKNLVEAFQMYREFGSLPFLRKKEVVVHDDPGHKVPTNVWLRGRIAGMMAAAPENKKKPLEDKIAEEWQQVKAKKDLDAMRSFVDMFDVQFAVGREARLHLAETIVERDVKDAFLEAELNLQQLRGSEYFTDVNISARALAGLAKLEEKKTTPDAMKLAAMYYRELRRVYPEVILANNKTGQQLLDELTTDPRFLHLLEEPGPLWTSEKFGSRELRDLKSGPQGFVFQPEGDATPLMKQTRLLLDTNTMPPKLHCYNFACNAVRWTLELGMPQYNNQVYQVLYSQSQPNGRYSPNARFRYYQVRGNLAVVQVGTVAYCLDMDGGKILWQQNLFESPTQPNLMQPQVVTDADGNLEFVFRNQFGQVAAQMSAGHVGAVQASYVALMTPKGLLVVDPLHGTPLWRKKDLRINTHLFGDDQHLFTVDMAAGNAGTGRAYRAIDGATVNVADFGGLYQNRVRIVGKKLLVAVPGIDKTLKLYDIIGSKELWSHAFNTKAAVLTTEEPGLTGVIEPSGQATVLDVESGKTILQTSVLQAQISLDDVANLEAPLLLRDRERYYFALNQPISTAKVRDGVLFNNFGNGLRCQTVNGWVLSYFREDGQHTYNGKVVKHKKADFDWCSPVKIENQLLVVEQFENLPVMLFTSRYQPAQMATNTWTASTLGLNRATGKRLYWSGLKPASPMALFGTFSIEPKDRTINLIGLGMGPNSVSVQIYVDDGRKTVAGVGMVSPLQPNDPAAVQNPNPAIFPPLPARIK